MRRRRRRLEIVGTPASGSTRCPSPLCSPSGRPPSWSPWCVAARDLGRWNDYPINDRHLWSAFLLLQPCERVVQSADQARVGGVSGEVLELARIAWASD